MGQVRFDLGGIDEARLDAGQSSILFRGPPLTGTFRLAMRIFLPRCGIQVSEAPPGQGFSCPSRESSRSTDAPGEPAPGRPTTSASQRQSDAS